MTDKQRSYGPAKRTLGLSTTHLVPAGELEALVENRLADFLCDGAEIWAAAEQVGMERRVFQSSSRRPRQSRKAGTACSPP